MNKTKRKMPTHAAVRKYWSRNIDLTRTDFDSEYEFISEKKSCFACGKNHSLEMAHIIPRQFGGSDLVSNIHLLCWVCHKDSENIMGDIYFDWLYERTFMDQFLSLSVRQGMGFNINSFFGSDDGATANGDRCVKGVANMLNMTIGQTTKEP